MQTSDKAARLAYAAINRIEARCRALMETPPERIRPCLPRLLKILSLTNRMAERQYKDWKHLVLRGGIPTTDAGYCYRALWNIKEIMFYLAELRPETLERFVRRLVLCEELLENIYYHCWPKHALNDGWGLD